MRTRPKIMKIFGRLSFYTGELGSGGRPISSAWTFLVVLAIPLGAWSRDYQVRDWQVEDGLPDNTVTALAQTPDGYLWVGTRKGLARFDGDSFKRVGSALGSSLEDPRILGLQAGRPGELWIVSQSGLVTRFWEGEFQVKHRPNTTASAWSSAAAALSAQPWHERLSILARDATGDIWTVVENDQVIRFTAAESALPVSMDGLPGGNIRSLANDSSGRIWLLKGTNVCVFAEGHWAFSKEHSVASSSRLLCAGGDAGIYSVEVNDSQSLAKLVRYQPKGGWEMSSEALPTTPAHPQIMAMLSEPDGQLWLAQCWSGIFFRPPGDEWRRLQTTGPAAKCTADCLFKDQQNNLWIGTFEQGLLRVRESPVKVVMLPPEEIEANLHVTSVAAAKDGGFWAGTDAGLHHGALGESSLGSPDRKLGAESVYSVLEDSRTNLWVGARSGLFHRTGQGFQRVISLPQDQGGILALYEARNGSIWAAGPWGSLFSWRGGSNEVVFEPIACDRASRLHCITEDGRGRIWIGAENTGVWRVEGKKLVADGPPAKALGLNIRALLFDEEGALWVGTLNGLFHWEHQSLRHYTTKDGLPNDMVIGLATDGLGNIWMTSRDGIVGVSRRQLAGYVRGTSPALLCQQLRLEAGLRYCSGAGQPVISALDNGWFGAATMLGVTGFNPKILAAAKAVSEPRIEALKVDGFALQTPAPGFRTPASTRRLEFQYSAPELNTPENLRFRYRLDGLDQDWIDAGRRRSAAYSQLPPGHYKFRVMVGGASGVWRETKTPADLQVIPRFWQTVWFRLLGVATAVLILAGLGIWNERRKIRRRMERLETRQALEQMRNRIARDLHDELGSAITGILQHGNMMLRVQAPPGQLRATVEDTSERLRQLSLTLDEIVWTMNSRNDILPNLAGYISNYAQEFLHHSGIRCRLDVVRNLPNTAVASQTRHNLFLAVKEALNNAAKHSGADEVVVRVHFQDTCLRVCVEDNGRGFDGSAIRPGEGLANMRERMESVKGRMEVGGRAEGGTRVAFSLNLSSFERQLEHPQS